MSDASDHAPDGKERETEASREEHERALARYTCVGARY